MGNISEEDPWARPLREALARAQAEQEATSKRLENADRLADKAQRFLLFMAFMSGLFAGWGAHMLSRDLYDQWTEADQ